MNVTDRMIEWILTGEQQTVLCWGWSAADRQDIGQIETREVELVSAPLTSTQREDLKSRIGGRLLEANTFSVNGRAVTPTVAVVRVPSDDETGYRGMPGIQFVLRTPLTELPESVGLEWALWDRIFWQGGVKFMAQFRLDRDNPTIPVLSPEEPGYTWRPDPESRESLTPLDEVRVERPKPYVVPVLSLACLLIASVLGVAGYFLKRLRPVLAALVAILATTAFLGRSIGTVEIEVRQPAVVPPNREEAIALFEQLHANLYRAFEANREALVYQRLQSTVTNDLVPDLYLEIHQSLVMRQEAGAYCQIESVTPTEKTIEPEPLPWLIVSDALLGRPRFDVEWSWEAEGVVSHWGHEHRRTNLHRAQFAVVHDGASWKIAAMETEFHDRKDRDG